MLLPKQYVRILIAQLCRKYGKGSWLGINIHPVKRLVSSHSRYIIFPALVSVKAEMSYVDADEETRVFSTIDSGQDNFFTSFALWGFWLQRKECPDEGIRRIQEQKIVQACEASMNAAFHLADAALEAVLMAHNTYRWPKVFLPGIICSCYL